MQPLITQYWKSVPVSHGHQHQTSCSDVWTQETMQLRTVCDKCPQHPGVLRPNFYRHSANLILFVTLRFFETSFQKNVKSHVFLKSERNT